MCEGPACTHKPNASIASRIADALVESRVGLDENTANSLTMTSDLRRNFNATLSKSFAAAQAAGKMSAKEVAALQKKFRRKLEKAFLDAFNRGIASRGVFQPPLTAAQAFDQYPEFGRFVNSQATYSDNFVRQLGAGELSRPGRMGIGQRLTLYANSIKGAFNFGAVAGGREGELIYWRLGACDHCPDCPVLNLNSPYTRNTLPTMPGSGGTLCKSNCCCYLSFKPGRQIAEPQVEPVDKWINPPKGERLPNEQQLARLRDMEQRKNAIRRKMAFEPDPKKKRELAKLRKGLQRDIIDYTNANNLRWTPEFSVGEVITGKTLPPKVMDDVLQRGLDGGTLSKADMRVINQFIEDSNQNLLNAAREAGLVGGASSSTVGFGVKL